MNDDREHVMTYRAGTRGLAAFGLPDGEPGWSCRCGAWAFRAKAIPRRKTGNNQIEALRSYRAHVEKNGNE